MSEQTNGQVDGRKTRRTVAQIDAELAGLIQHLEDDLLRLREEADAKESRATSQLEALRHLQAIIAEPPNGEEA